jgi:molybdopterin molybdotransferase
MNIEIQITNDPIQSRRLPENYPAGAIAEFSGVVRDLENGGKITALEYEAYSPMAEKEMRRILESLAEKFPCLAARVIHRIGIIPVGETAIYICIAAQHRGEAFAMLAEFMNRLKRDVPIWKRRGISAAGGEVTSVKSKKTENPRKLSDGSKLDSLDEAVAKIQSRCGPLPAVCVPLEESFGLVLRETVCAPTDLPDCDRSTRDGYAVLRDDSSDRFQIVETIHAADWKPRQLKSGEAVRVATGAALPCENLRVVMQEHARRIGDKIRIAKRENDSNVRKRGEDVKAGQSLVRTGVRLDAGKLALLASAGCAQPLVGPLLRVVHFTTGDEIIPPDQTPKPGQVRDSNSILIRSLLWNFPCDLHQAHLPEDFEKAKAESGRQEAKIENADVILISGGASVGDKDFTRELLVWLGFEIIFNRVNIRPGAPLIFAINGGASVPASRLIGSLAPPNKIRVAFGLPGNPLSHFICFHLFVTAALAKLVGEEPKKFLHGRLAGKLDDSPNPRETLWPARLDSAGLHPLKWSSSGDVTCLAETNALIRVPAKRGSIETGAEVEFLPADF